MPVAAKKKRSPFHPEEQARTLREPRQPSALMEFILSLDGEIEYREALIEFQNEWCDHPGYAQEAVTVFAAPFEGRFEYELRCQECGLIRRKKGRISNASSR